MSKPNLEDPETRAAYRRELAQIARPQRMGGLALSVIALGFFMAQSKDKAALFAGLTYDNWGWMFLIAGWALFIWGMIIRTRYHKERMNAPD